MGYTYEDILKIVEEKNINFIRLQFTDINGNLKNIAINKNELEKALSNKCTLDGSSIDGFARIEESDMYLRPDLDTFELLPWRPTEDAVARMICDVYLPSGEPFLGDPRYILKNAIEEAEEMGYEFQVGPECEFFVFHRDEVGRPTIITHDEAGYFDLDPMDLGSNLRREVCLNLQEMGFDLEASHHEVANGQHEIDFKYDEALHTADNIMTFKMVVKAIAKNMNLAATFMPKPKAFQNGSGMHMNMSLFKDGVNVFYDREDPNGLSKICYSFIAGIMKHAKALTTICNSTVNSYKRLVLGYEAPVHIAWSCKNRSPLIRIPASRGNGTRIELRSPDPACNPYLAIACCLKAGLEGIKEGLIPPDSIDKNIYEMTEEECLKNNIDILPSNLKEALEELKKDDLIKGVLGEHALNCFIKIKENEWKDYTMSVSDWELKQYINK